jgi:hypothetical protein
MTSRIEWQWQESGRGGAPHLQSVASTPVTRTRAAYTAYSDHVTTCQGCGEERCPEGQRLSEAYLEVYRAEGRVGHDEA